jgi:hypothetical protein
MQRVQHADAQMPVGRRIFRCHHEFDATADRIMKPHTWAAPAALLAMAMATPDHPSSAKRSHE